MRGGRDGVYAAAALMQDSHPKNRLLPSKLADNTGLLDSENAGFSGLKTGERLQWLFVVFFC